MFQANVIQIVEINAMFLALIQKKSKSHLPARAFELEVFTRYLWLRVNHNLPYQQVSQHSLNSYSLFSNIVYSLIYQTIPHQPTGNKGSRQGRPTNQGSQPVGEEEGVSKGIQCLYVRCYCKILQVNHSRSISNGTSFQFIRYHIQRRLPCCKTNSLINFVNEGVHGIFDAYTCV